MCSCNSMIRGDKRVGREATQRAEGGGREAACWCNPMICSDKRVEREATRRRELLWEGQR